VSAGNFKSPVDFSSMLVRRSRCESGFSLIELAIVVLLVAIVSVVAYSRLSTGPMIVSTQADRLASAIRYAQTLAMTQGARYEVVLTSTTYAVYRTAAGVATLVAEAGSGQIGPYTFDSGVIVTVPPTNLPNSLVTFDGRGIPYTDATSPGTILSPSAAVIQISKEGDTRSIVITPETGSVAIQ
jgi:prepilin-type N-terminal cleavage/methylation domain-containing protein